MAVPGRLRGSQAAAKIHHGDAWGRTVTGIVHAARPEPTALAATEGLTGLILRLPRVPACDVGYVSRPTPE